MDNIINSLDAFFGDYFGINFRMCRSRISWKSSSSPSLSLPVVDLGAEHAAMDAVPWTAGRDRILYIRQHCFR